MNKTLLAIAVFLLVCLFPNIAASDYLIVSRNATIKAEAHRDAEIRARVTEGQYLGLLSDMPTNRYYEVSLPGSDVTGYVYHTLARRYPGAIPDDAVGAPAQYATNAITPEFLNQTGQYMFLHFLDVDQADAAIIELPCGVIMIDAGHYRAADNSRVVDYLREFFDDRPHLRRDTIDALFLTHNHDDHTRSLRSVFREFTILNYIDNGDDSTRNQARIRDTIRLRGLNTEVRPVLDSEFAAMNRQGLTDGTIDPVECESCDPLIHVLAGGVGPDSEWWSTDFEDDPNNQSIAIRVDFGESSVLFTGDMEEAAIGKLTYQYDGTDWLDIDLYQVGHHGAANATDHDLLAAMSPDIAVISAGDPHDESGSRSAWAYGHPRRGVISMIAAEVNGERVPAITDRVADGQRDFRNLTISAPIYSTGWDGDVIVRMDMSGAMAVATRVGGE